MIIFLSICFNAANNLKWGVKSFYFISVYESTRFWCYKHFIGKFSIWITPPPHYYKTSIFFRKNDLVSQYHDSSIDILSRYYDSMTLYVYVKTHYLVFVRMTYYLVITTSYLVRTTYLLVGQTYFLVHTTLRLIIFTYYLVRTAYYLVIKTYYVVHTRVSC